MPNCANQWFVGWVALLIVGGTACGRAASNGRSMDSGNGGGTSGDATCSGSVGGAWSTWQAPRATISWSVSVATDGGVPAELDAGPTQCAHTSDGGTPASGCTGAPGDDLSCSGAAIVRRSSDALTLELADGSVVAWDPLRVTSPVAQPALADGSHVWVSYRYLTGVVCPFCGTYYNAEIQIRDCTTDRLLWIAREGHTLDDVSAALVTELFGTSAHEEVECRASGQAGCYPVDRVVYNHVLETTPEQVLPHAVLTRVSSPNGAYDVIWAHSDDTVGSTSNCADGPGVASDTAFAASWISP